MVNFHATYNISKLSNIVCRGWAEGSASYRISFRSQNRYANFLQIACMAHLVASGHQSLDFP